MLGGIAGTDRISSPISASALSMLTDCGGSNENERHQRHLRAQLPRPQQMEGHGPRRRRLGHSVRRRHELHARSVPERRDRRGCGRLRGHRLQLIVKALGARHSHESRRSFAPHRVRVDERPRTKFSRRAPPAGPKAVCTRSARRPMRRQVRLLEPNRWLRPKTRLATTRRSVCRAA